MSSRDAVEALVAVAAAMFEGSLGTVGRGSWTLGVAHSRTNDALDSPT
jgi:hypothetical protein